LILWPNSKRKWGQKKPS